MATRRRKSCKYGKLKKPVRTKRGGKRRCKKRKSKSKSKSKSKRKSKRKSKKRKTKRKSRRKSNRTYKLEVNNIFQRRETPKKDMISQIKYLLRPFYGTDPETGKFVYKQYFVESLDETLQNSIKGIVDNVYGGIEYDRETYRDDRNILMSILTEGNGFALYKPTCAGGRGIYTDDNGGNWSNTLNEEAMAKYIKYKRKCKEANKIIQCSNQHTVDQMFKAAELKGECAGLREKFTRDCINTNLKDSNHQRQVTRNQEESQNCIKRAKAKKEAEAQAKAAKKAKKATRERARAEEATRERARARALLAKKAAEATAKKAADTAAKKAAEAKKAAKKAKKAEAEAQAKARALALLAEMQK